MGVGHFHAVVPVIDLYASQPQYLDHLAPAFLALPADARGSVTVPWQLSERAALLGLGPLRGEQGQPGPGRGDAAVLVAGYVDHRACRWQGRETVWLGHGAGQHYGGDGASASMSGYPGGVGHDGTLLFLEAGERAADRWREHYPGVPAVAVGSPKLDARHAAGPRARARTLRGATVAFAFHFDCPLIPETRSAWRHYSERMGDLAAELRRRGAHVVGHGHPRERRRWDVEWPRAGVEPVAEWDDVLDRADVVCVDNSSAGPEAASVGVPVVWLGCPWYRRGVDHGGRFWSWTDGQPCAEGPGDVVPAVVNAIAGEGDDGRAAMVADVYAACDGRAGERAAEAILAATAV